MVKQIFMENTNKYCRFLSASDVNLRASAAALQTEIATHQKIRDLITAGTQTGRLDRDKLSELITASCPDFITMSALQMMGDNANLDNSDIDEYFSDAERKPVMVNCAGTRCETCWKNYINQMARILNGNAVDIKSYGKPEGGPHGS